MIEQRAALGRQLVNELRNRIPWTGINVQIGFQPEADPLEISRATQPETVT